MLQFVVVVAVYFFCQAEEEDWKKPLTKLLSMIFHTRDSCSKFLFIYFSLPLTLQSV